MDANSKDSWFKWGTRLIVLSIIAMGLVVAYPIFKNSQGLRLQLAELDRRIELKKQEIKALKTCKQRFRDDREFIESIARQNRRVYPGELVFVFEDD